MKKEVRRISKLLEDPIESTDQIKSICEKYLKHKDDFSWFIKDYFGAEVLEELDELARINSPKLFSKLNDIWFHLPDSKFNIIENPKGWEEFLYVIEV